MPAQRRRLQVLDRRIIIPMIPVLNSYYCLALGTSLFSVNSFLDCKPEITTYFYSLDFFFNEMIDSEWTLMKKDSINHILKYEESLMVVFLLKYWNLTITSCTIRSVYLQSCCIHLKTTTFCGFKLDNAFRKHHLFHLHLLFSKTLNNCHSNLRSCRYQMLVKHKAKKKSKSKTQPAVELTSQSRNQRSLLRAITPMEKQCKEKDLRLASNQLFITWSLCDLTVLCFEGLWNCVTTTWPWFSGFPKNDTQVIIM